MKVCFEQIFVNIIIDFISVSNLWTDIKIHIYMDSSTFSFAEEEIPGKTGRNEEKGKGDH